MQKAKTIELHDEMRNMEYEPLNKMEIKLIAWSLTLGSALLVVLYLLARVMA